jgi:hypothetical protein
MSAPPTGDPAAAGSPDDDRARRFLAAATAWTSAGRGDWGRAMLAELDQVAGGPARWRFALGAARTVLVPPRSRRLPWRAAIILAAGAATAAAAIHVLAPGAGIQAAAILPGLPAICAWLVLARSRPAAHGGGPSRVVRVIAAGGIAACAVVALVSLARYPAGAAGTSASGLSMLDVLAVDLTGALWLVLRLPAPLAAGRRSSRYGLAAALAMTGGFLLNQLLGLSPAVTWTAALGLLVGAGGLAAWLDGGPVSGIGAALWTLLIAVPAWFIVSMTATSRAMSLDARDPVTIAFARSQGAASALAWVVANDLGGSIVVLTVICLGISMVIIFGAHVARDLRPAPAVSPAVSRPWR